MCSEDDLRFSVFDNLIIMHCLPLGTAAVYDLLLPPDVPSDGSMLPLFQPLLVITGAPRATFESTIQEPTDEQSVKMAPAVSTSADSTPVADSEAATTPDAVSSSPPVQAEGEGQEEPAPAASAVFLAPCHAVDISRHTIYRYAYEGGHALHLVFASLLHAP
jgi:hypothetical protein